MIKKIQQSVLDMMDKISLSKEHDYTRKSDGKLIAGVSSVASLLPKDFLAPWASKMAVSYLGYEDEIKAQEVLEKLKTIKPKEYQELLHEAKNSFRTKSDEAKIDGTAGHEFLERYVKAKIRKQSLPKLEDDKLKRPIEEFIKWETENIKQWILSEALVYNEAEEYAGTLDGLAITKDDKLAVIDFKFANQISADYYLQTAGYAECFKSYGIEIQDRIIVRLPKTLEKKFYNKQTRKYEVVENNLEIGRSPFSLEFDAENFIYARKLYRYSNAVSNKFN